jgi:hypothetical protein
MWISLTNRRAKLTRATAEEKAWLREYLTFPDPGAVWRGKSREEAVSRLFEEVSETFPGGFITAVQRAAKEAGIRVEVIDGRVRPAERDLSADLSWLRDYQRAALEACVLRGRGIVHHTVAAGKSEIMVALTRALPCPWLLLAPNLQLVNNVADRFEARNREHGVDLGEAGRIGEGRWVEGERLTCATYQSIQRHLREPRCRALLERCGGLMCDESHGTPAATFMEATEASGAYFRLGFSATPLARGDMRSALAVAALGPIIHRYTAQQAVAAGVTSAARIRFVLVRHPLPDGYTFDEVYRELVSESAVRNAVLAAEARRAEKPALLFVKHVGHGRALLKAVRSQTARGFEADDVLASLVGAALGAGMRAVVVGLDKDLSQLVTSDSDDCVLWDGDLDRGAVVLDGLGVEAKFGRGCFPERVADYLAVAGDSSDGIRGVVGAGPVAALKLINAFPSLEEALQALGDSDFTHPFWRSEPKLWAKFIHQQREARLCRELVTLRRDAPLALSLAELRERTAAAVRTALEERAAREEDEARALGALGEDEDPDE